jgi:DeoR family galactitol utilization operon repressor
MLETLSTREKLLLEILTESPNCTVNELGKRLSVSEVTIRSDLKGLAGKGLIVRTHGGARPAYHKSIVERQSFRTDEKNRIAKAAADLVSDGDTVMIVAGTTTALVAKYLLGKGHVHIVTDSTLVLPYVRSNPSLQLTMVGGEFRSANESFVGPLALDTIRRFNVRLAFLGTDGFTLDKGLTTHLVEGAEMVKTMAEQAEKRVLVVDSSKFGRSGFVSIMPLKRIDTLISDTDFPADQAALLTDLGIDVHLV